MMSAAGCVNDDSSSAGGNEISDAVKQLTGHWEGLLQVQGQPLWLHLDIAPAESTSENSENNEVPQIHVSLPYALISRQSASQISLQKDRKGQYELSFTFSIGMMPASVRLHEDSIKDSIEEGKVLSGTALMQDRGTEISLHAGSYSRRYRQAENADRAGEEITLKTPYGPLYGTLLEPSAEFNQNLE